MSDGIIPILPARKERAPQPFKNEVLLEDHKLRNHELLQSELEALKKFCDAQLCKEPSKEKTFFQCVENFTQSDASDENEESPSLENLEKLCIKEIEETSKILSSLITLHKLVPSCTHKDLRKRMTYKILIEEDSFVPKWFGYTNEIAPPLCGAIPASTDYIKKHIKPNHLVVAYVDSTETKKDNKDSETLMDDKNSETSVDEKNSKNLVDDKNSENLVDDINSENRMDDKNSENCADDKKSTNCMDEKNSENGVDDKYSENGVDDKYSENWILAQLIKIDENKCFVYDVDVSANQFYEVDIEDIIPLPICKADPVSNPEAFFRLGSIVLAPAEYSSCFYPALVIALPKTIDDTYSLKFKYPGEALMFGDVVHVPQSYVVQHKKLSQNIGRCT